MAGIAWVNGRLLAPGEPAIAAADRGFLYGEGLFETMRAYRGRIFRLGRHLDRLIAAAPELGFVPPRRELLERATAEALAASGMSEAAVRLTVTPGPVQAASPTVVVLVRDLALPPAECYQAGCRAVTVPAAQAAGTPLRRTKSLNYLDKLLAQRGAARAGAHEAIIIDPDGCVVEGGMRNVFAVIAGGLVTPPLSRGLLPGVTREAILEIAEGMGLGSQQRELPVSELRGAD